MNHWPFIVAAYAITLTGTGGALAFGWRAMRRAERRAETLGRARNPDRR